MISLNQYIAILESYFNNYMINEASSIYNKLAELTTTHEGDIDKIKNFIAKNSIKKVLNAIGKHAASMRNSAGLEWPQKWGITNKSSTEFARGAFGRKSKNFTDNVKYIFSNILMLEFEKDYELTEPAINRDVSSNSKLSIKVTLHFDTTEHGKYESEFYICDNQLSENGEEILLPQNTIMPTAIGVIDTNRKYNKNNIESIFDDITDGLKHSLNIHDNNDDRYRFVELLIDISKRIYNNTKNKDTISSSDLIELENKKIYDYSIELTEQEKETWSELDDASKRNIQVFFGEILTGLALYNSLDDADILYWPSNPSEALNDLYINGIGISVKSKNSSSGHKPEVASIAERIVNPTKEFKLAFDSHCKSKNINKTLVDEFINIMKAFYNEDKTKKSREAILWNLMFNVFGNDNDFKEIVDILQIKKDNQYKYQEYILRTVDEMEEKEREKLLKLCFDFSKSPANSKTDMSWNVHKWSFNEKTKKYKNNYLDSKDREKNYSKIMHAFQLRVVNELNTKFINGEGDLFSICVNNIISSKQAYVNINKNCNNIKFTLESMNKCDYLFSCMGSTWKEWSSHANIGFKVK